MHIGLFIPCYVDQFYPQVAIACLELLEKLGVEPVYPIQQSCCGQPLANSGFEKDAIATYRHFVHTFQEFDYVVAPSGSCVYHVRKHYDILEQSHDVQKVRASCLELSEFLLDVLKLKSLDAAFPHKIGIHQSCHGLRGLRLAQASERVEAPFSKIRQLLDMVDGISFAELDRVDECCGFGGTFAVQEEAISVKMGKDRIEDHLRQEAEYIVAGDMSCLMHLQGIIKRKKSPLKVLHFAEILNSQKL